MSKVFITDRVIHPTIEKRILGDYLTTNITDKKIRVLLVWHQIVDKEYLDKFPSVELIIRYGVGYDKINLEECRKRNIIVCNNPSYCTEEVSTTALAMILNSSRNISRYDFEARKYTHSWQENVKKNIRRNSFQTVGFIGVGRIGSLTLHQCNILRYKTRFYDPFIENGYEKVLNSVKDEEMYKMLSKSDIVSLHCPLNKNTQGLVDENFIQNMKKGSSLVNTARGGLIKNLDIIEKALKDNHLKMVSLDVLPCEPPQDHSLIKAWREAQPWVSGRLIINPHASYYSEESSKEQRVSVALNALRFLKGETPLNIINKN